MTVNNNPLDLRDPLGYGTPLSDIVRYLTSYGLNYITARLFGFHAHQLIQADIEAHFPGARSEVFVAGPPSGFIDVILPPNQIYEIKPLGGSASPERQILRYIAASKGAYVPGAVELNNTIEGWPLGLTTIEYFTPVPGWILYTAYPSEKLLAPTLVFVTSVYTADILSGVASAISLGSLGGVI